MKRSLKFETGPTETGLSEMRPSEVRSSELRSSDLRRNAFPLLACAAAAIVLLAAGCSKQEATIAPSAKTAQPVVIPQPPKPPPSYVRDHYTKLDDCVHDWGYPQKCTPVPPGSASQYAGASFLGPIYVRTYREETQAQLRKEAIDGGYVQKVAQDASDRSISKSEIKPEARPEAQR